MGPGSKPTLADEERFRALNEMGCIVSILEFGQWGTPGDIHHVLYGGRRHPYEPNQHTVCIRPWYHRGVPPLDRFGNRYTVKQAKRLLGPSMALEPREFVRRFGDDRYLLMATAQLLDALKKHGATSVVNGYV